MIFKINTILLYLFYLTLYPNKRQTNTIYIFSFFIHFYGSLIMSKQTFLQLFFLVFLYSSNSQAQIKVLPCVIYETTKYKQKNYINICDTVLVGLQKGCNEYSDQHEQCFTSIFWYEYCKIYGSSENYHLIIRDKYVDYCNKGGSISPKEKGYFIIIARVILDSDTSTNFYVEIEVFNPANNTSPQLGNFEIALQSPSIYRDKEKYIKIISDSVLILFKQEGLIGKFFKCNKADSMTLYMAHMDSVYYLLGEYIAIEIYQGSSNDNKFDALKERIKQDNHFYQKYFEKKLDILINLYDNAEDSDKKRGYTNDILQFLRDHFSGNEKMTTEISRRNKRLSPALQMIGDCFLTLESKYRVNSESNPVKKKNLPQKLIEEFLNKVRNKEEFAKPKSSASTLESNNNK